MVDIWRIRAECRWIRAFVTRVNGFGILLSLPVCLLAQADRSPVFIDVTASSGVTFKAGNIHTSEKYLIEPMGGGAAVLDYDSDGFLDLFLVNAAATGDPMPEGGSPDKSDPKYWNRLYRNNGDWTFTDVTEKANVRGHSYGMGVAVADYNNDGYPDLYVTNFGPNILYRNNGDGTFSDVTEPSGVPAGGWSVGAGFLDYDRDGFLDLFVARYLEWDFSINVYCGERKPGGRSYCHPDQFGDVSHLVYHNNRDGTFTDVSEQTGFAEVLGRGLGIAFNDFDHDGWPDVVVANDAVAEQLFRNRGDGTFEEVGLLAGVAYDENGNAFSGMGVDFADFDNDGWPDIFIGDLAYQKYSLFRNSEGRFHYVTERTGVGPLTMLHSGWGLKFIDYDNDGWKDLFIGQGHIMDNIELSQPAVRYVEPPMLLRNVKGEFRDVSKHSGEPFQTSMAARGVAFGDLDNDGYVDAVINCDFQPARILRNMGGNGNNWILVTTVGKKSNRDGIGTKVRLVSASGMEQHAFVSTAGSYLSASDKRVHFGLAKDAIVSLLEITWPSGIAQRLQNVAANQILVVREPGG